MKTVFLSVSLFIAVTFAGISSVFAQDPINEPEPIWGIGNNGYIAKFNGLSTIDNSGLFQATNGNIGLGTTTPGYKFHVNGTFNANTIYQNGSALVSSQWTTAGSNIHFNTTGNVGIGTTSPTYKLHVNGSFSASSIYLGSSPVISSQWTTAGSNIHFNTTGNVGIGTSSPLTKLDLGTSGIIRAQSLELGEGWSRIDWNLYWAEGGWKYRNNGWGANLQMNDNDGSIQFVTYASGTAGTSIDVNFQKYAMTIKPNGNIGIGTVNPQSLLAVNGKITAKEVEVTMTGWSDFVFADNYKLMPLNELEKSIKANKHLPGIPSEKEVLANGISLGEMQAKLLQKVEELTLYVIDLKKENDQLKKQMDQLTK